MRCLRQKLYHAKYSASAARRLARFFENERVKRVSLLICIIMVKFALSTCDVQILIGSGLPRIDLAIAPVTLGGEPRGEKGRLKHKLFQRPTDNVGHPKLREHSISLIALMKAADHWPNFAHTLNRAFTVISQMHNCRCRSAGTLCLLTGG